MFTFTTICHKTSDSKQPMLMLTNREGFRYFFGKIPEGAQRVLNENGVKLGKLKSIFLTGTLTNWSDIGGLPGLFLTISDATSRGIDVFTNLSKLMSYIVTTWRYFVFRKGIELNILDALKEKFIGDSSAAFRPVVIPSDIPVQPLCESTSSKIHRQLRKISSMMFPMDTSKANDPDPDLYRSDPSENEIQTHVKLPSPAKLVQVNAQPSLNYVIRFLPIRGKFDPQKAKALGVKPGFAYRKLTSGESVLSDDNVMVHLHQVMEPSQSFPKVVIIDIPDSHYLQNTINSTEWLEKSEETGPEEVGLVYHFLGDDIDFQLDEYTRFLLTFPPECQHIISHSSIADNTLVFKTAAVHLLKLKCLLNENFTLPHIEKHKQLQLDNLIKLQSLQTVTIDPTGVNLDELSVVSENWSSLYDKEFSSLPADVLKADIFSSEIVSMEPVSNASDLKDHVQVVTLGTGSALPSIHRNVISSLVRIPYVDETTKEILYNTVLLDGGENTFGSMLRNYGHNDQEQLKQVLLELGLIYLSHLHADHHLGLLSVIGAWFEENKNNNKKLYLIIPWQYNNFVSEWNKLDKLAGHAMDFNRIVYFSCEEFMRYREPEITQLSIDEFEQRYDQGALSLSIPRNNLSPLKVEDIQQLFKDLHIVDIKTVRAIHCYWAYSASFTFALDETETFKLSYSGDTRPNVKFVDSGYNSDLLIHEASLDNELIEEALAKKHSTLIEAVKMSQLMNCPKVILTHFSTRYSEKHNFIADEHEYNALCKYLKDYLGRSAANLFELNDQNSVSFNNLQICYAYDLMTIRYKNLDSQKGLYSKILQLRSAEESEVEIIRRQKEMLKKTEKREAKRLQRLSSKRKRRPSQES